MRLFAWLLVIGTVVPGLYSLRSTEGEIHAVLVAGSEGWWNYRHQSNACHAYHVLRRHGVLPENIILMIYDDMATDPENPYPGKLFNRPDGEDVYKGVKIDYSGDSVTPENFLNVLKGDASAVIGGNGRVLKTKPNDRIFVFYSDHGASGVVAFPNGTLTVKELHETLNWMYDNKRYNQLVFYLDACQSGSMFDTTLKDDKNIYATTSAHGNQLSFATYCDNKMNLPCLGGQFAVNWMENSDVADLNIETLNEQFSTVKTKTNMSQVCRFGDFKIAEKPVGWFLGEERMTQESAHSATENPSEYESWPEYDVELLYLYQVLKSTNDPHKAKQFEQKIRKLQDDRRNIEALYTKLVNVLVSNAEDRTNMLEKNDPVKNIDCHHDVVRAFTSICVNWHKYEYAMKLTNVLTNLCNRLGDSKAIIAAMNRICFDTRSRFL